MHAQYKWQPAQSDVLAFTVAVSTLVIAIAVAIVLWAQPFAYPDIFSVATWRVIYWLTFVFALLAATYLVYVSGRYFKSTRILLSFWLFIIAIGGAMFFFHSQSIWLRGLVGGVLGAASLVAAPFLYCNETSSLHTAQVNSAGGNPSQAEKPQGTIGLDLSGEFNNNTVQLRSSGIDNPLRSTGKTTNNSFNIISRRDNGPVPEFDQAPVRLASGLEASSNKDLTKIVSEFCALLARMQTDIERKAPDIKAAIELFRIKADQYRTQYSNQGSKIEYALLYKLGLKLYPADRPTLFSTNIPSGRRPFMEAADYLNKLLQQVLKLQPH